MRVSFEYKTTLRRLSLTLEENCHTDTFPLVQVVHLHNCDYENIGSTSALAAACLIGRHCGEVLEFRGIHLGLEFAEAIRILHPWIRHVGPIDGKDRVVPTGEIDILCGAARTAATVTSDSSVSTLRLDWHGDFVSGGSPGEASSKGFRYGRVFTNASLLADETAISVAVALFWAGSRCRRLIVPDTMASPELRAGFREALRVVGIEFSAGEALPA